MTDFDEEIKELRYSLPPIDIQNTLDELACGSIIFAKTDGFAGPIPLIKNSKSEWKMFNIKGIRVEELEGEFSPRLPALLIRFG